MDTIATLCDSFLTLEASVKTDLVQLRTDIFDLSEVSAKDEKTWELSNHPHRAAQLEDHAVALQKLESTVQSLVEVVRSMARDVAANLRRGEIIANFVPDLAQLCIRQQEWSNKGGGVEDNSFQEYQRAELELSTIRRMAHAVAVIHFYTPPQLACIFSRFLTPPNGAFRSLALWRCQNSVIS
jgi:hypothetical protein